MIFRRYAIALALTTEGFGDRGGRTLLALWHRDGAPETVAVALPWAAGDDRPRVLFGASPQPSYD